MSRNVHVEITNDKKAGPTISRKYGDQIRWTATGTEGFTVCFLKDACPFATHRFYVPPDGKEVLSGPVRSDAEVRRSYEYVIQAGDKTVVDPTIFVDP